MSRLNDLVRRPRPEGAFAAQLAVDLVPRPRPALGTAASCDTDRVSDPAPDWFLAEPVDWDRDWVATQAPATDTDRCDDDLDDEYLDVVELDDIDLNDLEDDGVTRDDAFGAVDDAAAPAPLSRRRRLPATPRRRPALLLAALAAGAVIAALPGGLGGPASSPSAASGRDYGLGVAETGFAGGVEVAGVRGEISQAEAQARLGEIAASRAARQPAFVLPTQGRLTTCFCQRWGTMHWGLDLAAPLGTPIVAAADGVVLRAGPASGYGNAIYVQDADGNVEIYGHMRYMNVHAGDVVSAGELIAKVGSEGQSTGPHLHFEIHQGGMNGKPTDPQDWLADRGITVD